MTLLPVIERELRAAARHPFTYTLRLLGVMALLLAVGLFALEGPLGPGAGAKLFSYLHCTLFFVIWILVPLLTVDTISRERREGTLPLLFLTPLKSWDIVYSKSLAHGLRAFTLWLAVLPVLTLCFVAGGVGWAEVVFSVLVNFSAICLALGAGLVASARTKVWTRALGLAVCLAVVLFVTFLWALPWLLLAATGTGVGSRFTAPNTWEGSGEFGLMVAVNWQGIWQDWLSRIRPGTAPLVWAFASVAVLALLGLWLMIRLAAWSVHCSWQEQPPSPLALWLREKLCTPVLFQRTLRRWLQWQLQHNPIGWLEQRTWSGRLVVWSWLAIVTCVYSSLFANVATYHRSFHWLQSVLAFLLLLSLALCTAGSFRRERETGVLELLLVSPLREWQIIAGRLRGLWSQFLPALLLLCAVWVYGATFLSSRNELPAVFRCAISFATLPVVGLYFSLTRSSFITALLWTLLTHQVVPAALNQFASLYFGLPAGPSAWEELAVVEWLVPAVCQVLLALGLAWQLHANLKGRRFAVDVFQKA